MRTLRTQPRSTAAVRTQPLADPEVAAPSEPVSRLASAIEQMRLGGGGTEQGATDMPLFTSRRPQGIAQSIKSLLTSSGEPSAQDMMKAETAASTIRHNDAITQKAMEEVKQLREADLFRRDPQRQLEYAATASGVTIPDAQLVQRRIRGDTVDPATPNDDEGNVNPRPLLPRPNITNEQERGVQTALAATMANLLATNKTNADQLTQAGGNLQSQGILQNVQKLIAEGKVQDASAVNQGGKLGNAIKLFDDIGSTGATYAPATGAVQADPAGNPLLAGNLNLTEERARRLGEQTNEQQRHNRAVEGLHARGQNMTDARAREALKAPAGYMWNEDRSAVVPIPGYQQKGAGTQKPTEGYLKQQTGVENVKGAITEYQDALKNWGALDIINPNARARMGTVYNNLMLQAKEAYNLGVLNGPDYMILQQVITNPLTKTGAITSNETMSQQADKLNQIMANIGRTSAEVHNQPVPVTGDRRSAGWSIKKLP